MSNVKQFCDEIIIHDTDLTKIRLGGPHDGGYVAYQEICEKTGTVYSFGIGNDVSFELDFVSRFPQAKCRLYDPFILQLPANHPNFTFVKEGTGNRCLVRDIEENSLLKIDAEWGEWEFFLWVVPMAEIIKFSQIIVEFHIVHVEPRAGLSPYFNDFYRDVLSEVNERIFSTYYRVMHQLNEYFFLFHIHANNSLPKANMNGYMIPPLLEISFIRKDLAQGARKTNSIFPVPGLDLPNKTDRADVTGYYPLGA